MKPRQITSDDKTAPSAAMFLVDSVPSRWTTEPPEKTDPAIPKSQPDRPGDEHSHHAKERQHSPGNESTPVPDFSIWTTS